MNEKALQVLEQYDLEVLRSYGGRGGIMLETKEGLKMLKEFAGSRSRLPLEQRVLERLAKGGVCAVDRVLANREGELVSVGDYETPYVVKDWPAGRECDPKNEEEILRSTRLLARVHRELRGVLGAEGEERRWILGADRTGELEKHNRELKRARNFIRGRQKKGEFELLYLKYAEDIFRNGAEALELLKSSESEKLYRQAVEEERLCHGEYVHHNVLLNRQETALVNFARFEVNVQLNDLCLFLRKMMEKHNWSLTLAERMLAAYEQEIPLSGGERLYLAASLCYPEKAWKLIHHYYHTNKAWVPEKSAEKLRIFLSQSERRKKMVKNLLIR